eukprot:TRINITY_DN28109_c0_g1_i1.p1 TRINITY_DN28109_c0_g1~~TRINITY_DN28109_c0_g1_i1.p1  ORF type:complete len:245 (+),score=27.71 TRINITY_DN28109_c0_g1_i1:80-736(+)
MGETEAVSIMRDVLLALEHVHALDIVHRDVKPENVGLGKDSVARLMDFGIATSMTDGENLRTFSHSVGYAAPELLAKKPYGFPVDTFALGATFYFALSRKHAFATSSMTSKSIAAKTKKGVISFGKRFDRVREDTTNAIRWLMHESASWRPTASEALNMFPFSELTPVSNAHAHACVTAESPAPLPVVTEVQPPKEARRRSARPVPRPRPQGADLETN